MAFFGDLELCSYFGNESTKRLRAVGWLERDHEFRRGNVPSRFLAKLKKLLAKAWQPCVFRGFHQCTVCPHVPETLDVNGFVVHTPRDPPYGLRNLFVPGDEFLYVAPELIVHYIEKHGYVPPREFLRATERCPEMNSSAYVKAIRANGPRKLGGKAITRWTWLSHVDPRLESRLLLEVMESARRRAALAACQAAVEVTRLSEPSVEQALEALRRGRGAVPALIRAAQNLADRLYEDAFNIQGADCPRSHPHPGQPCEDAYRRHGAARAVSLALTGDPVDACEAIFNAYQVLDRDWKSVKKIVVTGMSTKGTNRGRR